jgi:hypothetical protein
MSGPNGVVFDGQVCSFLTSLFLLVNHNNILLISLTSRQAVTAGREADKMASWPGKRSSSNISLRPPCSIINIFGNWLNGINNRFKKHIRVGAIAFIWSLWLYRNDKVFNDKNYSMLQVIYRAIGTLCLWSSLQRLEDRDLYTEVCVRLEATTRDTFSQHG